MKKIFLLFFIIMLLAAVSGCGETSPAGTASPAQASHSEAISSVSSDPADAASGQLPADAQASVPSPSSEPSSPAPPRSVTLDIPRDASAAAELTEPATEPTTPAPVNQTVVFRFAGDFTQAEQWSADGNAWIMEQFDDVYGGDITKVFDEELLGLMRDADVFMLNNEFVYSTGGSPRSGKKWTYRATPERVANLTALGVDIVGLANNHAFDWGEQALLDTLDILTAEGIPYAGAGRDIDEAGAMRYFEIGGKTFSIVAATCIEHYGGSNYMQTRHAGEGEPGVFYTTSHNGEMLERCLASIREAKQNSDYCFMFIHWGIERTTDVEEEQFDLARSFIDAGADAVVGAHPHVLQGFDSYNGKPILYSLGNYWFNMHDLDSCLLEFTFETLDFENVKIRFIPCRQRDGRTTLVTEPEAYSKALRRMQRISFKADIDEEGYVTAKE